MPTNDLDFRTGPETSRASWEALARKALRARALETLDARTLDGIVLKALATREDWPRRDASGVPGIPPFLRGTATARGPGSWDIRQSVRAASPEAANTRIREEIAGGADSTALDTTVLDLTTKDLDALFDGLPLETMSLALDAGANAANLGTLLLEAPRKPASLFLGHDAFAMVALGQVSGEVDAELKAGARLARASTDAAGATLAIGIDARPYHMAGATPTQELAFTAAAGLAYLRALTDEGLSAEAAARQIAFTLVTDADFFASIAKLRAFRRMWGRILEVSGAAPAIADLHLTATTSSLMLTRTDADTNILRSATAAFAAALGSANAITALPHSARLGPPSAEARRLARNTQIILREEARAARTLDPAGGAFALERLSEEMAVHAWRLLQDIEAMGGMGKAVCAGYVGGLTRAAWDERQRHIAHRSETLVGVSRFVAGAQGALPAEPNTASSASSLLPTHHLADDFEALTAASAAHIATGGERPEIFLIPIGTEAASAARLGFARMLFEAGGIAVRTGTPGSDAQSAAASFLDSGIRIACLCGPDGNYAEHGTAFAYEIKEAGARYLYLAGQPGPLDDALLDAGIDEFIAEGCDAVAVLTRTHDVLGVGR